MYVLYLFSDGQEVAVVYFRSGYMPENYTSEQVFKYIFISLEVFVRRFVIKLKTTKHDPEGPA